MPWKGNCDKLDEKRDLIKNDKRHALNGQEIREEEHDSLPQVRQAELSFFQEKVQLLRLRRFAKAEALCLAEEVISYYIMWR